VAAVSVTPGTSAPYDAAALVERVRSGAPGAEEELVQRFGRGISAVLRRSTRTAAVAQDLYQDTFRLAIEKIRRGEIREPAKLAGFLCSLARNLAVDHYRGEARHKQEPLEAVQRSDSAPGPLERLLTQEKASLVRQVIGELDGERDRELLFRFYIAEEDKERLCEELGLTSLHFNRVLFRARQRYKELYERRVKERGGSRWNTGQ
jgi:RNA polymerase sigma-70 factor, ECF subfamily